MQKCLTVSRWMSRLEYDKMIKTVYPNKVFDYMAASRPVIVAIDGVARKLVEDAQCGYFVEPENSEELAQAIKKLRADLGW